MFNRKKLAVPSVLLASVLFLSAGVSAATANDASGSEEVSVEAVKETPAEALAEETKKAEEVSAIPEKDMQTTPVGDPVVAPAPLVEPAPAPAVPEPAAPAPAPAEPKVATPVAPAAPDAPAANLAPDVAIDNSVPSTPVVEPAQDAPTVEEEIPPACQPSWDVYLNTFSDQETLPGWGTFMTGGAITCGVAGASYGNYTLVLTNATFYPEGGTVGHIGALKTSDGENFDSANLFWKCAKDGASYSLVDNTTGLSVTGVVPLPGGVDVGDSRCGTITPTKEIVYVTPEAPKFNSAGEGVRGSVELPSTVGVVYTVDPAGATEGPVKVTAVAAPETADTVYVIAPGAQTEWSGDLGEFIDVVPNPGTPHEYAFADVKFAGQVSPATLVPFAGPFIGDEYAYPEVKGTTHDGSPVTVSGKLQMVIGGVTINDTLDLSPLCGKATWTWYGKADIKSTSPKWIINAGFIGNLPACDPQGEDDGDDNENPGHPGHPGHGDDDDDHGHDHDCDWWHDNCNGHAGGPGFNGPTTTPGDLINNDVTDSSVNSFFDQQSDVLIQAQGSALPLEWSSDNSSESTGELAATGLGMSLQDAILLVVFLAAVGIAFHRFGGRRRPKHRMAR